jgi:hypothetical protein
LVLGLVLGWVPKKVLDLGPEMVQDSGRDWVPETVQERVRC